MGLSPNFLHIKLPKYYFKLAFFFFWFFKKLIFLPILGFIKQLTRAQKKNSKVIFPLIPQKWIFFLKIPKILGFLKPISKKKNPLIFFNQNFLGKKNKNFLFNYIK